MAAKSAALVGSRRHLALKALGLLDALSDRQVEAAISGNNQGARITVSPAALSKLLASVEAAYPGILNAYRDTRGLPPR